MTLKHRSDNPHVGHERALQLEGAPKPRKNPKVQRAQAERSALCRSEIACAVADAYIELNKHEHGSPGYIDALYLLDRATERLEQATRTSPLRKVLP